MVRSKAQSWLTKSYDAETRAQVQALLDNEDPTELIESFYKDLEFGTGGLRGIMGVGSNRMNIYTVGAATQGLSNYLKKEFADLDQIKVVIGHDCRNNSRKFAEISADIFSANGIKVYLFEDLRPTPEMSYTIRKLGCQSGIILTASHNPKEYNGYKAYWDDGAQMIAPHDKNTIAEVNKIRNASEIKFKGNKELIEIIGKEIDEQYINDLTKISLSPESIARHHDMKIVYTPLHGTGNVPVRRVLRELGFNQVYVVKEQKVPDGNFPTVAYPNPEDEKAWTLALKLAKEVDADIILATDPDADRLGVYAKDSKTGEYVSFTGNMSGMLIAEYILRERTKNGTMPENPALVETIVTTDMAKAIAKAYNVALIEVLTGFKYIGEQIKFFEQSGAHNYVFGLEESYGCLAGTYARDKDACVAVMMLCEVAAYYKQQGKTLWDAMVDMYEEYGYYKEGLATMTLKGIDGAKEIQTMMTNFRENPPKELGGFQVLAVRDYKADVRQDLVSGEKSATGLPSSNVLYYELENNAWCCVRPSGTEPKIKFYFGVKGTSLEDAAEKLEKLKNAMVTA